VAKRAAFSENDICFHFRRNCPFLLDFGTPRPKNRAASGPTYFDMAQFSSRMGAALARAWASAPVCRRSSGQLPNAQIVCNPRDLRADAFVGVGSERKTLRLLAFIDFMREKNQPIHS
jgi:hypothetical protein